MGEVEVTPELMQKLEAAGIKSLRAIKDNPDLLWAANLSRSDVAELQAAFDATSMNGVVFIPVRSDPPEPVVKDARVQSVPLLTLSEFRALATSLGIARASIFSASESIAMAEAVCLEKNPTASKEKPE